MVQRIKTYHLQQILKNNLFLQNQKIGLAVSGGIDSMVMLDVFRKIRKEKKLELYVMHYNHKWRKGSNLDARLVEGYCKQHQIRFLYKETKGKVVKDEEIARNQRYLFFTESAKKHNQQTICTAHHKDDQLETVLFRLARGTGPHGLFPIKESFDLSGGIILFRPFLGVAKKQIHAYAKKNKVTYIEDKTNNDLSYKRNLIRKKIIPLLKKINKEAVNNILVCSDLVYSQNIALSNYFSLLLKNLSTRKIPTLLDRKQFLRLNGCTQKAFLYWFLTLRGIAGSISKINIIGDAIKNQKNIDLSKKYALMVTSSKISLEQKGNSRGGFKIHSNKRDLCIKFPLNGRNKKITLGDERYLVLKPFLKKRFNHQFPEDNKGIAYVDLSRYKERNLTLRYRKPKDVFHPLGFSNLMKFKKYLINKKISKEKRYNLPLLCLNNEVLWLPGYCLSEKIKVLNKPTHVLEIGGGNEKT